MPEHGEECEGNKVKTLPERLKEKMERTQQVLEHLAEESAKGTPIIVEGKKDIETMRMLKREGKRISAKTGG